MGKTGGLHPNVVSHSSSSVSQHWFRVAINMQYLYNITLMNIDTTVIQEVICTVKSLYDMQNKLLY